MVRCHICGKEVVGEGHVEGITPGSDTLKLGLCTEHDSIENRGLVREQWKNLMLEAASRSVSLPRVSTPSVKGHEITIRYLDGGVKTVSCSGYQVNNENELLVAAVGREYEFYPLQHVRSFTVSNILAEDRTDQDADGQPEVPIPGAQLTRDEEKELLARRRQERTRLETGMAREAGTLPGTRPDSGRKREPRRSMADSMRLKDTLQPDTTSRPPQPAKRSMLDMDDDDADTK